MDLLILAGVGSRTTVYALGLSPAAGQMMPRGPCNECHASRLLSIYTLGFFPLVAPTDLLTTPLVLLEFVGKTAVSCHSTYQFPDGPLA
jgi:hypothetical protein